MMLPRVMAGLALTLALLSGCRTADLRPPELREGFPPGAETRGRDAMDRASAVHGAASLRERDAVTWTLEDVWFSSFLRWFTPLESNEARVRLTTRPTSRAVEAEILAGGPGGTFRVDEDGSTTLEDPDGRRRKRGGQTRLYVESLAVYLGLPFRRGAVEAFVERRELDGRSYDRIYVSDGVDVDSDRDQYVYWIDADSNRVELIEFTYRDLLRSYRGTLFYDDFRPVGAALVPHRVRIGERPAEPDVIHELRVEAVSFE